MILTALGATALGLYSVKTGLSVCRDRSVRDVASRTRDWAARAAQTAKDTIKDATDKARARRTISDVTRQSDLLISRVFERGDEDEKATLTRILTKYCTKHR